MFLSWLHRSWKYFWTTVLILFLIVLILAGGLIGGMQLQPTKEYLARWMERNFNETYHARLTIGELEGFIPFNVRLDDVRVLGPAADDSSLADTLIQVDRINANMDIWSLLQNKISINGFSLGGPRVRFMEGPDNRYTIYKALTRRDKQEKTGTGKAEIDLARVEIVAPNVTVTDGRIDIEGAFSQVRSVDLPDPLHIKNIDARMFLELNQAQRFWDIEALSARLIGVKAGDIRISGQVYNDDRFLEFNAFTLSAGDSGIRLNGEINGVNLYREQLREQLSTAFYNIDVSSEQFKPAEFSDLVKQAPAISAPLEFSVQASGIIDSLRVDNFSLGVGESYFRINGFFQNLLNEELLKYQFQIAEVALRKKDVEIFSGPLDENQFNVLENLRFNGKANGRGDSLNVDLNLNSPHGQLSLRGGARLTSPYAFDVSVLGKGVDLSDLIAMNIDTTNLTFDVAAHGLASGMEDAVMELNASVYNSFVNDIKIDELELTSSLADGLIEHDYVYRQGEQMINGSGWIDLSKNEPPYALKGTAHNINLAQFIKNEKAPSSKLNFDYNMELRGLVADRIRGRANIDVKPSVIGGDSLQSHQLYMDLNSPDQDTRSFRLTSSLFDLNLKGNIEPSNIIRHLRYWAQYAQERFKKEILLAGSAGIQAEPIRTDVEPLLLDGSFRAKNLLLIKRYWPGFPVIATDTRFGFNINADSARLLLSVKAQADSIRYNQWKINGSDARLTASFRRDKKLKEFSSIDLEADVTHLQTGLMQMDSLMLDLAFREDSLIVTHKVGSFSDDARLNLAFSSLLTDTTVSISIRDFYLGNEQYAWNNETTPTLVYNRSGDLHFGHFSFENRDEYFALKGTLSPDRADSLLYVIRDVNLGRISQLIDGRVNFSGKLSGNLLTRSLTRSPSVQGALKIDRFAMQNRIIGDATFTSEYNPDTRRFDTRIEVVTDTVKYADYLQANDYVGQNIVLDGYFVPPDPETPRDTVYSFDANFNEIDMWVLPLIVKVFDSMEGRASGEGYLRGNFDYIDFHADFQTSNVYAKPRFLETNYFLNGHVVVDREDGVIIDSVDVTDTQGGKGMLWGTVDLNDFNPITFLDLSLSLDELQFLNNDLDPDVPFYGTVAGTGLVKLTGANTDLFLRTTEPVAVTTESQISIPLTEETELSGNNKFIQFVDSLDPGRRGRINLAEEEVRETMLDEGILKRAINDLTFNERFNLDLQFTAPDNINVDLIFDPVTGEVLTGNGTGQLRITMQGEEVQMFGRYNITGGSYQFVSGEIFTRELDLESGGSIAWQGDPENARLNISAVYHARPHISTLNYQGTGNNLSEDGGGQRVPVDLVVEINGTVSSVENNYYFRLPNSLELSSNSTLSVAINQINREEQQKLLQAASILLTGNFIPTQSYSQATTSLRQSLTRGSTVINPLLSSQVISPLLSNQMNALLNSDVSRFDIDFNLNAYNEIDLGIALRLYNDKLIFRREGQITGGNPESTFGERIGDLNATYRINQGLSVTAFHRQDQALGTFSGSSQAGDVTPSVDGVGLEAQVQFNTWQDLGNRIESIFRSIFGLDTEGKEEEKLASEKLTSEKEENK